MNKILSFGRSCKAYLRLYKDQGPDVKLCCKDCNRKLHKHGRYFRWVASKSEHILIPIYRWLCPNCGTTVSLLPDFLIPWARFTTWVRESAIVRKRQGKSLRWIAETITYPRIGLSSSTVKRWWKQSLARVAATALWMSSQLVTAGCEEDLLRMYPKPIAAKTADTWDWFEQLVQRYAPRLSRLRGYWTFLNARIPRIYLL